MPDTTMQDFPLTIQHILGRMRTVSRDSEVATATGSLRKWAAGARYGRPGSAARRSELDGALSRLREVRPIDPELRRARRQALTALGGAAAIQRPTRAQAQRGLSQAERLAGTIHRVVREDPRFSALMPD